MVADVDLNPEGKEDPARSQTTTADVHFDADTDSAVVAAAVSARRGMPGATMSLPLAPCGAPCALSGRWIPGRAGRSVTLSQ